MKYKIKGIAACILAFIITTSSLYMLKHEGIERYHQHLKDVKNVSCNHNDNTFCTHLPLIQISTSGKEIPGKIIGIDDEGNDILSTAFDGTDAINASIKVTDKKSSNNHLYDEATLSSDIRIGIRGHSSRGFVKKNYTLKLIDENGNGNEQKLLGMDSHSEWVLHGPILDKTLIRNYLCYNLAGEIMSYSPNVRFCEMTLNDEYQGLYLLCETITAGNDGGRINLSVNKKDNSFSGYLIRLDRGSDLEIKNVNSFSQYTYQSNSKINIVYPNYLKLTKEMNTLITKDFSQFEKTLYSYDYDTKDFGYKNLIDVNSFVDYFILNEFTGNRDSALFSTYIYKDTDGKFRMCVWDFNSAFNNYQEQIVSTDGFFMHERLWYNMLTKDEDFVKRIISRYKELRKTVLSDKYIDEYIDDTISYLGDAIDRNYEKWGYTFDDSEDLLISADRNPKSFNEAVNDLKSYIKERGSWIDENIDSLMQYAVESKVKKYNENTN